MKQLIFTIVVAAFSAHINAGIGDSVSKFFGDKEESSSAEEKATSESSIATQALALLPMLTQNLGVTEGQAQGGLGALLQAAKSLMSGSDFGSLAKSIPNMNNLLAAAPSVEESKNAEASTEKSSSLLGQAMDMAAEHSDKAQAGKQLIDQFESLGLNADMIPKFAEITNQFLKQEENSEASSSWTSALAGII